VISHFFIDRPIFATVLSIVFVIVGGVALTQLPIAQYPDVAPPTVQVTATATRAAPSPLNQNLTKTIPFPPNRVASVVRIGGSRQFVAGASRVVQRGPSGPAAASQ